MAISSLQKDRCLSALFQIHPHYHSLLHSDRELSSYDDSEIRQKINLRDT